MAARRCGLCGVNYPVIAQFEVCPIHDEPTELREGASPDLLWQDKFTKIVEEWEKENRPYPLVEGVPIIEEQVLFVRQEDLQRAGLRLSRVQPDQFFLFELDGWVYETQGWDEARRRWWVERVAQAEGVPSLLTISAVEPSSTASETS